MGNKKIPNWFYDLFQRIAIKHNLTSDLSEYYLEGSKKIYLEILKDINSGKNDNDSAVLRSVEHNEIGNLFNNDEDKVSKTYNGTQFLFISEFYYELYSSMLKDVGINTPHRETSNNSKKVSAEKLTWKGTPGQFAYIIDLLINKGYIKKPTQFAERNARIFLEHFDFSDHHPSDDSLGQLLHKETDAIKNPEHKGKFQKIPHRNELDK